MSSTYLDYEKTSEQINMVLNKKNDHVNGSFEDDIEKLIYFIRTESRTGKTTVLLEYCRNNSRDDFYLNLPPMEYKSCKLLLQVMLQQIEREIPHRGTDKELFRRFASYLKFNNIRKLIIDDIHSLSDRASIELFTLLLLLNKELDLKFICAGTKIPGLSRYLLLRSHLQDVV